MITLSLKKDRKHVGTFKKLVEVFVRLPAPMKFNFNFLKIDFLRAVHRKTEQKVQSSHISPSLTCTQPFPLSWPEPEWYIC